MVVGVLLLAVLLIGSFVSLYSAISDYDEESDDFW